MTVIHSTPTSSSFIESKVLSKVEIKPLFLLIKMALLQMVPPPHTYILRKIEVLEYLSFTTNTPKKFFGRLDQEQYLYEVVSEQSSKNSLRANKILQSMDYEPNKKTILYWKAKIKVLCWENTPIDQIDDLISKIHLCNQSYFKICARLLLAEKAIHRNDLEKASLLIFQAEELFQESVYSPRQIKLKPLALLKIATLQSKIPNLTHKAAQHVDEAFRFLDLTPDNLDWEIPKKAVRILASFDLEKAKFLVSKFPIYERNEPLTTIVLEEAYEDAVYSTISLFPNIYLQALATVTVLIKNPLFKTEPMIEHIKKQIPLTGPSTIEELEDYAFPLQILNQNLERIELSEKFKSTLKKIMEITALFSKEVHRRDLEIEIAMTLMLYLAKKHLKEIHS